MHTELGAHSLVPLLTERSTTGSSREKFRAAAAAAAGAGDSSSEHQASRLDRLALAATKQCLRAHALQLQPATSLEQLLPELQAAPISLVAAAGAPPILEVLRQQQQQHQQQQQQQQQQQPADAWWVGCWNGSARRLLRDAHPNAVCPAPAAQVWPPLLPVDRP
jgi:16S rRNA U1498 N3-methylase RsmE